MMTILLSLLVPVVTVVGLIGYVVWRGLQMKELVECGVETNAIVESKRVVKPGGTGPRAYKIVYRYTDSSGATHSRTTVAGRDLCDQYDEGSAFPIVYSSKQPQISARKDEVESAREATSKR